MSVTSRAGRGIACLLSLAVALSTACSPAVDFKTSLQIVDATGGWYDVGVVDGKNKLVPSVSFRIKKAPGVQLRSVDINVHFKKVSPEARDSRDAEEEFAEVFLQRIEFSEGDQTPILTIRPENGFTADPPQTRAEMLTHRLFQDIRARVFAKQSSTTWVDLLSYDVPRTLILK
jgi:hypothetical protein